jgi:hypothetical protein
VVRRIEFPEGLLAGRAGVLYVLGDGSQVRVDTRRRRVRRVAEHCCGVLRPHLPVLRFGRRDSRCVVTQKVGGDERNELCAVLPQMSLSVVLPKRT